MREIMGLNQVDHKMGQERLLSAEREGWGIMGSNQGDHGFKPCLAEKIKKMASFCRKKLRQNIGRSWVQTTPGTRITTRTKIMHNQKHTECAPEKVTSYLLDVAGI